MTLHCLTLLVIAAAALVPAPAAAANDGAWKCRACGSGAGHADGALVGTLTIKGNSYRFVSAVKGDPATAIGSWKIAGMNITDIKGPLASEMALERGQYLRATRENPGFSTANSSSYSAMGCLHK